MGMGEGFVVRRETVGDGLEKKGDIQSVVVIKKTIRLLKKI